MNSGQSLEFSYSLPVSTVGSGADGVSAEHDASDAEREALTARFGLIELLSFRFMIEIKPTRTGNGFRLKGRIVADVVQHCVVTLDPVNAHIDDPFELLLFDEVEHLQGAVETEEDYETFAGDMIDLGELAAVELALSLDPYPRCPGATGDPLGPGGSASESPGEDLTGDEPKSPTYRPFEGLAALQRKR